MSITKMIVENWDRGTPRDSTVVFAGQSHISRGMTVLIDDSLVVSRWETNKQGRHGLDLVLDDPHGRLEIKRLVRREVVEEDLLDGRLACSAAAYF